jgi:hypothetical protein
VHGGYLRVCGCIALCRRESFLLFSTSAHSRSMMRVRRGTEYRVTAFTRFISATVIQRNSLADERDDMEERAVAIFVFRLVKSPSSL